MDRYLKCCFTGPRPNKLPWGYCEAGEIFEQTKNKLQNKIEKAIIKGYSHFCSGMALGVDTIAAEIVLDMKKKYPHITLECAIPCLNQTQGWLYVSVERYKNILDKADKITYVSKKDYFNGCMQKRNQYMVDNSSLVIAVYGGLGGGTKQTIDYAIKNGVDVDIIKI